MLICNRCKNVFDESDVTRIPEYVDDSRIIAYFTPVCPFCGSGSIDDYYESGEENDND